MSRASDRCEPGHGRNRVLDFANRKRGHNKGIAAARREQKRQEAEARSAGPAKETNDDS
jgi:hypothetical protein